MRGGIINRGIDTKRHGLYNPYVGNYISEGRYAQYYIQMGHALCRGCGELVLKNATDPNTVVFYEISVK